MPVPASAAYSRLALIKLCKPACVSRMTAHTQAKMNCYLLSCVLVSCVVNAVTLEILPYAGASWWENFALTCTVRTLAQVLYRVTLN